MPVDKKSIYNYNNIMLEIKEIPVGNIFSKTSFRGYSYVINPYTGCASGCLYCYACFMQQFTNHTGENWGEFIDVKRWDGVVRTKRTVKDRNILMSTVTDPYNPIEKEYKNTRAILERLQEIGCNLTICTRSDLVLRDIDILKDMKAKVSMSVNTLDEKFVKCCENTTPVKKRLQALKKLHDEGIYTILCISPIFPYITDYEEIIEKAKGFVDEYWFENLNLRQPYKTTILNFIQSNYPEYYEKYKEIYIDKNREYWFFMKHNIIQYCKKHKFNYKIDFRHS